MDATPAAERIVQALRGYVRRKTEAVNERVEKLEAAEGPPGRDGRDGSKGSPGRDGRNGVDGFTDLDLAMTDDDRTLRVTLSGAGREVTKELRLGFPLDRGIWKAGVAFQRGDAVTYGGSLWIAQADTEQKPGDGADWRLAVKRGRDRE